MADPTLNPSVAEMNEIFLEGIVCPYQLFIADSKMPEAGSGLFVREEIPAGKELFRAMPVISVVGSSVDACDNCFGSVGSSDPSKPPVNLLTCASCKRVKYCSKRCQRAAWKIYHKKECMIYRQINTQVLKPKEDSLAIRMFIRLVVLHQHGQFTPSQWKAISALESHKELMRQSEELDLPAISADIRLVREVAECDMSESDLQDWYSRININQHSVDLLLQPQLGSCLVPSAALINHSCYPNAHHLSEGAELVVRSSRKIAKNEEITISYIDSTQSFEERQKALSTSYAFGCECRKCTKGFEEQGEILTGNSLLDAPIRNAKSKLQALLDALADDTQELDGVETKLREICNGPSSGKPWPINASPVPTLYELLARKFEDEQQWEKALHVWLKIVGAFDGTLSIGGALCVSLGGVADQPMHRSKTETNFSMTFSRISQMSEINVGVKASFHKIEAAMSVVQNHHNIQLKEDAAASLGTNNGIFKIAAHYVEVADKQVATGMGVPLSVWQSEQFKDMRKESYESRELELLKWAHIDLNTKTI